MSRRPTAPNAQPAGEQTRRETRSSTDVEAYVNQHPVAGGLFAAVLVVWAVIGMWQRAGAAPRPWNG